MVLGVSIDPLVDLLAGRDRWQANKCTGWKTVLKIPRKKSKKKQGVRMCYEEWG